VCRTNSKKKAKFARSAETLPTGFLCNQYNPEIRRQIRDTDSSQVPKLHNFLRDRQVFLVSANKSSSRMRRRAKVGNQKQTMEIGDRIYLIANQLNVGLGAAGEVMGLHDSTEEVTVRLTKSSVVLNVKTWDILPAKAYTYAVLCAVYQVVHDLERETGSILLIEPRALTERLIERDLDPQVVHECMGLFDLTEWKSSALPVCRWLRRIRDFYVPAEAEPRTALSVQRKEYSCASIELGKRKVSSRMASTDKINHGLEIRRGKSLGLFTRASLIGALTRAGFFIAAITVAASAQTREQIAAMQAQTAARQAQKNAELAISQGDTLEARLDAISQRDALQAHLEDATSAASQGDSPQNQPKAGKAGADPNQEDVASAADQPQPQQEPQSATPEALPAPVPAKPQPENEQAPASQNQAHRPSSESARAQRIHRTRETKTRNSAASTTATPFLSQLRNQWNRFWHGPKANP
jgi:hypothetical protein